MARRHQTGLLIVAAAIFVAIVLAMHASKAYRTGSFKAFYCAGEAVAHGADPYRVEPLRTCERSTGAALDPQEVEPAPFPGHVLAGFALLSKLPFQDAALTFSLAAALAVIAAALLLAACAEVPAALVLLVLMPLALLNIAYSEVPVFALAALALSGWALKKKHWALAGVAGALTLVQPQIAAPVALSLFILAPRTRAALLVTLAALAAISLAAIGPAENFEYLRSVLPAQAASELSAADQYSLSHILYTAGLNARASVLFGEISTVVMIAAGVAGAAYARTRLASPELIVFLPAAAVLLGGLYVHDITFIVALPAALIAVARSQGARRIACWLALTALAVVWTQHPSRSIMTLDFIGAYAALVAASPAPSARTLVRAFAAGVAVCAVLFILYRLPAPAEGAHGAPAVNATALAPDAWAAYLRATPARTTESLRNVLTKVPTWLGLLAIMAFVAVPVRRHERVGTIGSEFVSDVST